MIQRPDYRATEMLFLAAGHADRPNRDGYKILTAATGAFLTQAFLDEGAKRNR